MRNLSVGQIKDLLKAADAQELAVLEHALEADTRPGVINAIRSAQRRIDAQNAEDSRLLEMYEYEESLVPIGEHVCIVGLDEVGRGPLAGPLAVGAVVLPRDVQISGLNDSKKIKPADRERIAADIKNTAIAYSVVFISPLDIDEAGMTSCLKRAFRSALDEIESAVADVNLVLIDGNPLGIDKREVNVIKGDGKCASIAAASIIAKVERDSYMDSISDAYPQYKFESNKGYGTKDHIDAIKEFGISDIHRKSFCTSFMQETLF